VDDILRRPPFGTNPAVGERGSDTQRRIREAAIEVFADVGFHDARVELITKRAGCSRPAFYQYFSSKDDVFWKLAGRLGHDMVDLGNQLPSITPDEKGVKDLATWLEAFADLYDEYAPVFSAFQTAARSAGTLTKGSRTVSDRLGDALIDAFGPRRRSKRRDRLANAIVAVLIRCNFYRYSQPGALDRTRFNEGLALIVHRLLAGPVEGVNVDVVKVEPRRRRRKRPAGAPEPLGADRDDRALRPRGEKTRQRLLDAGASVLPSRGYHDARVDDLVEAAGVSHGSFYRYFENKDDFFRVLAEQASGRMIELLDAFPDPEDAAALRSWLAEWFEAYRGNGGVISTWQEMQTADPALQEFSLAVATSVLDRLVAILDARGFGDAEADALPLLAVIERLPYSVYTLGFATEQEAIEAMAAVIRRGFMGIE
jgi:AcrR family transcriptional regulator